MKKIADTMDAISRTVVGGYGKIQEAVVGGYKKIEHGAVSGFETVTDKCVEVLFARDGETVAQAKRRLSRKD